MSFHVFLKTLYNKPHMANLRQALYAWRDNEALKHGVELFRVLPNSAVDEIVRALPRTKEELVAIKGIKEAKYREYGKAILSMVDEYISMPPGLSERAQLAPINILTSIPPKSEGTVFSVGTYLDIVNRELFRLSARVRGEVTSYKIQGSALYFSVKDRDDESVLGVFMWLSDYGLSGIEIAEGLEVIIEGKSEIYKPSGRFNFRAQTLELLGEGALKKAYDTLKKKLDAEGVFTYEKKRALAPYPQKIGLITSKTGAVIHDFLNNLGKFGYSVKFMDSRVEGVAAVKDILRAISYFKTQPIDTLVIIRGGGSLESLQAFNNELVVRAIAEFPSPVICAIGHDKDMPLAQLAADLAPSTPTATTVLLNRSWEHARDAIALSANTIFGKLSERLWEIDAGLLASHARLAKHFSELGSVLGSAKYELRANIDLLGRALEGQRVFMTEMFRMFSLRYKHALGVMNEALRKINIELEMHDPLRQLKLGYGILQKNGLIFRSVKIARVGERFVARLSDGTLEAEITGINPVQ